VVNGRPPNAIDLEMQTHADRLSIQFHEHAIGDVAELRLLMQNDVALQPAWSPLDRLPVAGSCLQEVELQIARPLTNYICSNLLCAISCALRPGGHVVVECDDSATLDALSSLSLTFGLRAGTTNSEIRCVQLVKPRRPTENSALVSILIAGWNPRYFEEALRSALSQTYPHIEIVVGDDSRDAAIEDIVRKYSNAKFPIDYQRNPERLMTRANYESCFSRSRGEYVKYLNDDDLLNSNCVERLVSALQSEPSATLATSARTVIDKDGNTKSGAIDTLPLLPMDSVLDGKSFANAMVMLGLNFLGEPTTVLFRRSAAKIDAEPLFEFLGFPGRMILDLLLWTRLLCRGDAVYLSEPLSKFRQHDEQRQMLDEVRERGRESLLGFGKQWGEIGLHLSMPPNLFLARTLGQHHAFSLRTMNIAMDEPLDFVTQIQRWRNRDHPFFSRNDNTNAAPRVSQ
jgi:glycosyltransferase involved in cell wall biosynthesis